MPERAFDRMILAVFRGEDPKGVVWQPRIEHWYRVNKMRGTLPKGMEDADLLDFYDAIGASVRYFTSPLRQRYSRVKHRVEQTEDRLVEIWETPLGELRGVFRLDPTGLSPYPVEFPVKSPADLRILEYILKDEEWWFDLEAYKQDLERVGSRGVPQSILRRSPLQALFIQWMGVEATLFALHDCPHLIERYIEVATEADDRLYEAIVNSPLPIVNLGENIDAHFDSPPIFRDYLAPYYKMRVEQLHKAGKFVHIHMDGAIKPLLPHLREPGWDGIEAPTPLPQGDVTLEELKEAMGDLVLLDGIPAVYFLPTYPVEELLRCVKRIVELFHPRLILGVSDEPPPDAEFERLKLVGEFVQGLR